MGGQDHAHTQVADGDDLGVGVEHVDDRLAEHHGEERDEPCADEPLDDADLEDAAAAREVAGAVALPDEGRAGLAHRVDEVVEDLLHRERGRAARHDGGPELVDAALDHDVREREDGTLDARRHADADDLAGNGAVNAQLARFEADEGVGAHELRGKEGRAHAVAEHGRHGHAHRAPAEDGHERGVEPDVEHGRDGEGKERHLRHADAAEHGRDEVVEKHGRHAEEIYPQVDKGLGHGLVGDLQRLEQGLREQLAHDRDREADGGEKHRAVDGLAHGLLVARADGVGHDDVRADGDADEEVDEQAHDGGVRADGSHAEGGAVCREVPDDEDVDEVAQLLEDAGRRDGQGEQRNGPPKRAGENTWCYFAGAGVAHGASLSIAWVAQKRLHLWRPAPANGRKT